ncbi:CWF complex protein sap62 [Malassezia cuniculi]|uniref:CWF complex protein sap62 n=1 Tax=Malassezia cuniculi TaxID=948313 RepID=A0AAF0ETQ2_9BASI|nr:CWF complex protein sap62 [Malassezia cuniculi]
MGNKGAGVAGAAETNLDRRERLRRLALETVDLSKDPYILRNHVGSIECRLCLTVHANEGSYLAHTQGKKHQTNLERRAEMESRGPRGSFSKILSQPAPVKKTKSFVKIGRPGYKITKLHEPLINPIIGYDDDAQQRLKAESSGRMGLLFQVHLPEIKAGVVPVHRLMSSFEQRIEQPDPQWQYLVVAAEPYESIGFRLPSREIDRSPLLTVDAVPAPIQRPESGTWSFWDEDAKTYIAISPFLVA